MSRIKNMSRGGWIVVGVLIAMMLVPTGIATAAALKYTGIEGTSDNKADVTPAGQLLTTEAQPSNLLGGSSSDFGEFVGSSQAASSQVFTPPSNEAVVMDSLSLDVLSWSASGSPAAQYTLFVGNGACSEGVADWYIKVSPTGLGPTEIPLTPGVAVPAGDALCASAYAESGVYQVWATAMGFLVPASSVPNAPPHAIPVLNPANG
ncbi:MAG: hypothetical protein ABSC41_20600 [Acidimicrobiales bacterium]